MRLCWRGPRSVKRIADKALTRIRLHCSNLPPIPQELWEHIICSVEAPSDWRSCSLVSRDFRPVAQALLFHTVRLQSHRHRWNCFKIEYFLQHSPHLMHYIRRVEIYDHDVLRFLSSLSLPRLREIMFSYLGPYQIDVAQSLISIPSVRRVEIRGWMHNVDLLPILFERPTPHLQALELQVSCSDYTRIQHVPRKQGQPTLISQVELGTDNRATQWLLDAPDLFDLTQLTDVAIWRLCPVVVRVLEASRSTIRRLSLPSDASAPYPDLSQFPELRDLRIKSHGFAEVALTLTALHPPESLKQITFALIGHQGWCAEADDMLLAFLEFATNSLRVLEQITVNFFAEPDSQCAEKTYQFRRRRVAADSPPVLTFECSARATEEGWRLPASWRS
ncbi:hypothetical protein DFH09DRAFT_1124148 [Mycena vulgaris]|nr:hypothetical protein DFH09DRAFT_1124148 [Mycena vulgaris]